MLINMVGGGVESFSASISVINASANSVITATSGSNIFTATSDSSGNALIVVLKEGTYTLTCDGKYSPLQLVINNSQTYNAKMLNIPIEYQEVEYLQSNGTQYIDTNYAVSNPNFKFEVKYRKTSTLIQNVFGVDLSNNPRHMHGNIYGDSLYLGNSSVFTSSGIESLNNDIILSFTFSNNIATWVGNNKTKTYSGNNGWSGTSYYDYLFGDNSYNNIAHPLTGRIYYARYYDSSNVLVRYFIPCYRKVDSVAGMYETKTNTFLINAGSNSFVVGGDVV